MAELLLEREVLDGAEVLQIVQGKTLPAHAGQDQAEHAGRRKDTTGVRPEGGGRRLPGLGEGERPQPA